MPKIHGGAIFLFWLCVFFFRPQSVLGQEEVDFEPIVVKKASLQAPVRRSPVEALEFLPVDLQSRALTSGIQADFSLRGSTFQGTGVTLDHQPISDPQTAHHNSDIPLTKEDVESVELESPVFAPASGPGIIGGNINFILKKPKANRRFLELKGGEHRFNSVLASASQKMGKAGARFSLENQESAGFRPDTDFKKFTSALTSRYEDENTCWSLFGGYQEKEFGAYDFYTPASGYPSKEWTKTWLFTTQGELGSQESLKISPRFLWRRHYDKFMLDKTQIRTNYLNHHQTDVYTPGLYFSRDLSAAGKLDLGIEYGEEHIFSSNLGNNQRTRKSFSIEDNKEIVDNLSIGLAFRWDDYAGHRPYSTGSGKLRYQVTEQAAFDIGASRNIRLPSFSELYYSDPATLANPQLAAEKSLNYEAGYEYRNARFLCRLGLFLRDEKDFIDWVKLTPSQARWQALNISKAQVKGIEGVWAWQVSRDFQLNSSYTYISREASKQGYLYKYGYNYSRHLAGTNFTWKLPFGSQSIGITYKKKPLRRGWLLLHLNTEYRVNRRVTLFLEAENLCNVEYQDIEGISAPGRWINAGVRVEW